MAVAPLVNGLTASGRRDINEVAEYEKILKLRDEIFAGTHPRLTIANRAFTKVSPVPATQSSSASRSNVPSFVSTAQSSQLPGLGRGSEEPAQDRSLAVVPEPSRTSTGIDPVSLTNSDQLVRDELQRLRQRLEKALRDQFEQKRFDARKRPAQGEAKPDFDVAGVLAKVLESVKPDASSSPGDDASVSSFDENSLYSSRAPDSTPEAGELEDETTSRLRPSLAEPARANASVETRAHHERFQAPEPLHAISPRAEYDPLNPGLAGFPRTGQLAADNDNDEDEDEEGEYSPPEAMEQVQPSQDPSSQPVDPRSRPLRRYSDVENGRPGSPHDGNYRIVRNRITSPAAPQPFRFALIAEAKDPMMLQSNRARNGRNNQRVRGDRSPEAPGQGLHPRKKRKLDKQAAKRRRTGAGSPDVKDEPVSPPPFHDVQPLGSGRLRPAGNEPILIDDSPQEIRYVRANEQYVDSPSRPMSHMVDPVMPLSEPRTYSRSAMRSVRDDTNLRRVASLHSMRAEQPQYVEQVFESPSRLRAASYIPIDSPMHTESPRYTQDMPITYERERARSVRVIRTPAPTYHETYQDAEPEVRYVSQPMPPPPPPPQPIERIVVDEYGRKFREIIQERPSVAPRATPVYTDHERTVYDNYDRPRASSVMVGPAMDDRRIDNMPPPPRMFRQVVEPPRQEMYSAHSGGRAASVAVTDRPMTRQPVYFDDNQDERLPARVNSVRPIQSRYDDRAPQVLSRASSVRPVGREGSIYIEDRPQGQREYIQMETPQYQMTAPQPRYIDAQGREVIMEGGQPGVARYYPGY